MENEDPCLCQVLVNIPMHPFCLKNPPTFGRLFLKTSGAGFEGPSTVSIFLIWPYRYIYIYINNPLKPSYCDTSWGDSKLELFCFPDIFRVSANGWQSLSFFWEGSFWFKGESDASPTTQLASQQFFYKTLATWSWFSSFFGTDPIGCRFGTALSSRSGGVVWVIFVIFLIIIHH